MRNLVSIFLTEQFRNVFEEMLILIQMDQTRQPTFIHQTNMKAQTAQGLT